MKLMPTYPPRRGLARPLGVRGGRRLCRGRDRDRRAAEVQVDRGRHQPPEAARRARSSTLPPPGAPQTLLLVGVDHRYHEGHTPGNTDTMMLVRVNDKSSTINMLSIPRDLQVDVPGYGAREAQRGVLRGRSGPADQDDQGGRVSPPSGQPVAAGRLLELRQPDQRDRLRLRAGRPPLLQPQHRARRSDDRLLEHRHPARLPEAVRRLRQRPRRGQHGARVRALPPQRLGLRARVASAGLPALGQAELQRRQAALEPEPRCLHDFAKDVQSDHYLHSTTGLIGLFDLAIHADGSATQVVPVPIRAGSIAGTTNVSFSEAAVGGDLPASS